MDARNSWDVEYSSIVFIEDALRGHSKVASFQRQEDILFVIERRGALPTVRALLVNKYVFGIADLIRAMAEFPNLDVILVCGAWCGFSTDAYDQGKQHGIGMFTPKEFLGALWKKDISRYTTKNRSVT